MGKLQQESVPLNDADLLRSLLDDCERGLANLSSRTTAQQLILDFESVDKLCQKLRGEGLDLRAEDGRIESMETSLVRQAGKVVQLVGGPRTYARFRTEQNGLFNDSYWGLDTIVAAGHAKNLRAIGTVALVMAAMFALGYVFRAQLFPPNPVGDATSAAENAVRSRNYELGATAIAAGLRITPTNVTLLTWQAALSESLGFSSQSDTAFDALKKRLGDSDLYLERGQVYLRLDKPDKAISDFSAEISLHPQLIDAYYLRASAYEVRRSSRLTDADRRLDLTAALDDLQTCTRLAEEQHNDVVLASAKLRLGMLMQNSQ